MAQQEERMAPGNVYNPATGSGIEWQPGVVRLWEKGRVTESGADDTASPWDYWYDLAFADSFPQVTHWWFGSAWTGPVWLWSAGASADDLTISGRMQFVDQHEPPLAWQVTSSSPVQVGIPMPPFAVHAVNLPLRIVLAYQVLGLFSGDVAAAQPPERLAELEAELITDGATPDQVKQTLRVASPAHFVTSLVPREALAGVFPTTPGAWRLEQVDDPLRFALCSLMGLRPPAIPELWTVVEADAVTEEEDAEGVAG